MAEFPKCCPLCFSGAIESTKPLDKAAVVYEVVVHWVPICLASFSVSAIETIAL